jgi:hypothetical protein
MRDAERILEEYAWREKPLNTNEANAFQVEALVYTVAAECRSAVGFAVCGWFNELTPEARMCFYSIMLAIVENIPASRPRFHTLEPPVRGSYLRLT